MEYEASFRRLQLRNRFSLLCMKEAFLAIDPFEYQIKSNWNAVQVGKDSLRLQTPERFLKLIRYSNKKIYFNA